MLNFIIKKNKKEYKKIIFIVVFNVIFLQLFLFVQIKAYDFENNLIKYNQTFLKKRGEIILEDGEMFEDNVHNFEKYTLIKLYSKQNEPYYILCDEYGKIVNNKKYEDYITFDDPESNIIILEENKKYFIFNYQTGKFLKSYVKVESNFVEGLLKVQQNDLQGYINYDGNEVISIQNSDEFSNYKPIGDGYLWYDNMEINNEKIYDSNGKIILSGKNFETCDIVNGYIVATDKGERLLWDDTFVCVYDKNGKKIFESDHYNINEENTGYTKYKYDKIKMYGENYFFVYHVEGSGHSVEDFTEIQDTYLMNVEGKVVANFTEHDYAIGTKDKYWLFRNDKDDKTTYYILDSNLSKTILPNVNIDIYQIDDQMKNGYIYDRDSEYNHRFINKSGEIIDIIDDTINFDFQVSSDNTSWIYSNDEGKYNIIDTRDDKVIKGIIGKPLDYNHGIFLTEGKEGDNDTQYRIYSSSGELLTTKSEYYECENIYENTYITTKYIENDKSTRVYIFDENNKELLEDYIIYDSGNRNSMTIFKALKENKEYIVNYKGEVLFELNNSDVTNNINVVSEDIFVMEGKEKSYIYNINGNILGSYDNSNVNIQVANNFLYVSTYKFYGSQKVSKVEFYELFNQDVDIIDRTPQLIDCYPMNLEVSNNGNISMTFDIPIEFVLGKGNIYIKEYDTDKTVLTYNVAESPENEGVIYTNDTYTEIELENSLNRLSNKKYYIYVEDDCFYNKKNVNKWFKGIDDKDELTFTVLNNQESYDDLTFLAATSFVDTQNIINESISGYLNSDNFKNETIWNNMAITYKSFYKQTINNYVIVESGDKYTPYVLLIDKINKNAIVVLDNKNNYYDMFDISKINSTNDMTEAAITKRYVNVVNKVKSIYSNYDDFKLTITGKGSAGEFAAYLSVLLNIPSVVFDSEINYGVKFALLDNPIEVGGFSGIDKINCKNITTNWSQSENILLKYINDLNDTNLYNNLNSIKIESNKNGKGLGQYIELTNSNLFKLCEPISQKKSDGSMVYFNDLGYHKIFEILSGEAFSELDIFDLLEQLFDFNTVFVGSSGVDTKEFLDIVEAKIPHIYYNGNSNNESHKDIFNGGINNDVFVSTNGYSKFDGGYGNDTYIINKDSKFIEINDISSVNFNNDLDIIKNIVSINSIDLIKSIENSGTDTIIFKDDIIKEDDVRISDGYYEITSNKTKVKINMARSKDSRPINIISSDGSKFELESIKSKKEHNKSKSKKYYYLDIDANAKIEFFDINNHVIYTVDTSKKNLYYSDDVYLYTGENKLNAYINDNVSYLKVDGKVTKMSYCMLGKKGYAIYQTNDKLEGNTFILNLNTNQYKNELGQEFSMVNENYIDRVIPNKILLSSDEPYNLKIIKDLFNDLKISFEVRDSNIVNIVNDNIIPLNEGTTSLDLIVSGSKIFTIDIEVKYTHKIDINNLSMNIENEMIYTGKAIKPTIVIKNNNYALKENFDFVIKYENNINAGMGKAIIIGKNRYTSSKTLTFEIKPRNIEDAKIIYTNIHNYTGEKIEPKISLEYNNIKLKQNIDYSISYTDNIEIGEGNINIKGINNFCGEKKYSFNIQSMNIENNKNNIENQNDNTVNKSFNSVQVSNDNVQSGDVNNIKNWVYILIITMSICVIIMILNKKRSV